MTPALPDDRARSTAPVADRSRPRAIAFDPAHALDRAPDRAVAPRPVSTGAAVPDDTKSRLLAAAECLLAERGFEGMSMRALAARAQTSVSAANYHFGSKLGLVSAVFVARIEPINAERLARLDALLATSPSEGPRLEDVIDSLVRPSFEAWRAAEALGRAATPHLLAALHADPAARFAELRRVLFDPLLSRYVDALASVLPTCDPETLRVRLQLGIGVLLHVIAGHVDDEIPRSRDGDEALLAQIVEFMAAGLRAGASPSSGPAEARR